MNVKRIRSWNPNTLNWPSWIHARLGAGLVRIIKSRKEVGQLPVRFQKFADVADKNFPTIRSVMMAKPGWCIVEADYQTAEMRGLAYISQDEKLIGLIENPDKCFAKVDPKYVPEGIDPEDCVVRMSYPADVTLPEDKDKYILTYTVGGVTKAKFTEDQLLRDADGNIVSPRYDMHWGVLEMARSTCREVLDKKKDRGAGKVVNFCVGKDTLVLTSYGEKRIQDITLSDSVWDGCNWVTHKGVINYGKKKTIEHNGLRATPDHLVWAGGEVTTLLDAAVRGLSLTVTAEKGKPIKLAKPTCDIGPNTRNLRQQTQALREGSLSTVWEDLLEISRESSQRKRYKLCVRCSSKIQSYSSEYFENIRRAIQLYGPTVCERLAQTVKRLQRQRYTCRVQIQRGIYNVGVLRISRGKLQGKGVRQNRQQRRLRKRQSSSCYKFCKPPKHETSLGFEKTSRRVPSTTPGLYVQPCDSKKPNQQRIDIRRYTRAFKDIALYFQKEAEILESSMAIDVFDIIDAGEHHRFTAAGKLVSNSSSYGGQAASLARKVEVATGAKPELDDIQAMLDAIERRQPRATQFFSEMEEVPTTVGFIRAMSGRIRHCHVLADNITGLSARTREGQLTALGRECRNFPMQENVGASASRACYNLIKFGRETGLQGYLAVCLYDSCVVHCPVEERAIWAKALQLYMTEANGWDCGGRILRYPIDSELNAGWSTKPDSEFAKKLHDSSWHPTPDSIKHIEDWLDTAIAQFKNNPELSVTKY